MTAAKFSGIALMLLCFSQAEAGMVFRCKAPSGKIYYSDKGCDTGDPLTKPDREANLSVMGTGKFKPTAASKIKLNSGRAAAASKVQTTPRTLNGYVNRAEVGAARANGK